ncbi:hypothetical protein NG798_23355 [Ancylothrix sp. C2]|uniref:hypothetical protein n=1 Tax=Ancylothrix sp. D3o TaxID=2953691 RepID=UPI0021BA83E4|nr:hypothetical protein [Ancylothrix sp. D3o]MCT7952742.1 hypothetical protein [Ancylothrix sp. D3o]
MGSKETGTCMKGTGREERLLTAFSIALPRSRKIGPMVKMHSWDFEGRNPVSLWER